MRDIPLFTFFALFAIVAVAAAAFPSPVEGAEQQSYSGIPLVQYCNVAPDLAVNRTDSVDNWTKICSVWLAATGGRAGRAKAFGRWPQGPQGPQGSDGLGVDRRGPGPAVKPHPNKASSKK